MAEENSSMATRINRRNGAIEFLRCFLMLGICIQHCVAMGGRATGMEKRLFTWIVPCFVFISGYYGVRLKVSKILRLYALAAICVCVPYLDGLFNMDGITPSYHDLLFGNWFLNAYCILMLLSPILNAGLEYLSQKGRMAEALVGVMCMSMWSWSTEAWGIREIVPRVVGIGDLSFFPLLYVYVFAYCCRHYVLFEKIGLVAKCWLAVACLCLMPFVGAYCSFIAMILAALVFMAFKSVAVNGLMAKCVCALAPSMFSVYLMHTNVVGWKRIGSILEVCIDQYGMPRYIAFVLTGLCIFAGCVALDFLRRGMMHLPICQRAVSLICGKLDDGQSYLSSLTLDSKTRADGKEIT